jgi:signal transduction histidine kinase
VVQEALNNVARHSKAARAVVRLRYSAERMVAEVEDGGVGMSGAGRTSGMGLVSMRERAELVHGSLELIKAESGGLLVRLTVPLAPQEAHV